jgi:hypothetical protein
MSIPVGGLTSVTLGLAFYSAFVIGTMVGFGILFTGFTRLMLWLASRRAA